MRLSRVLLFAVLLHSPVVLADGQFFSGNALYNEMQRHTMDSDAFLMGYIGGAHDAWRAFKFYCSPRNATLGQMTDVVKMYILAHPEFRHFDADVLVSQALRNAWPCPPGEGKGDTQSQGGGL